MALVYRIVSFSYEIPELKYSGNDWLRIEQPDYEKPTDADFSSWLVDQGVPAGGGTTSGISASYLHNIFTTFASLCNDDGTLEVEIQVHKSREDLEYTISTSYGELTEAFKHTKDQVLPGKVSASDHYEIDHLVEGDVQAVWEGAVYGPDNSELVPVPEIVQEENNLLRFTQDGVPIQVSGVLRLKYGEKHDAYILTLVPREEGDYDPERPESQYEAVVTAVWGGGVEDHDVDLPEMDGNCGERTIIDPDDEGNCYDLYVTRHKCTNEIISEELKPVPCPKS